MKPDITPESILARATIPSRLDDGNFTEYDLGSRKGARRRASGALRDLRSLLEDGASIRPNPMARRDVYFSVQAQGLRRLLMASHVAYERHVLAAAHADMLDTAQLLTGARYKAKKKPVVKIVLMGSAAIFLSSVLFKTYAVVLGVCAAIFLGVLVFEEDRETAQTRVASMAAKHELARRDYERSVAQSDEAFSETEIETGAPQTELVA